MIDYNGFGSTTSDWGTLQIDSISQTPVDQADDAMESKVRHVLRGTALIQRSSASAFNAALSSARDKLLRRVQTILVKIEDGATDRILYEIDTPDVTVDDAGTPGVPDHPDSGSFLTPATRGYPRAQFEITEITGELCAVVGFTIEWETVAMTSGADYDSDAIEHVWSSDIAVDEDQRQVWTVRGRLTILQNSDAGSDQFLGSPPDVYRRLVFPTPPDGFRVMSQQYGVSEGAETLLYQVSFREHARALPSPATRGEGSFVFRRQIDMGGLAFKVFSATLWGNAQSNRGELLRQLILASKKRIDYAGKDIIDSIEVEEADIFSGNEITYTVQARSLGDPDDPANTNVQDIGSPIVVESDDGGDPPVYETQYAEIPDAYGSSAIRQVQRAIFRPGSEIVAAGTKASATAPSATYYTVPTDVADNAFLGAIAGDDESGEGQQQDNLQTAHENNPFLGITSRITITTENHLREFEPAGTGATYKPKLIQYQSPTVTIKEEFTASRARKAPDFIALGQIPGTYTVSQRMVGSAGPLDANTNRSFAASFERVSRVIDSPGLTTGYYDQSVSIDGVSVSLRGWEPPNRAGTIDGGASTYPWLRLPYDPRTEADAGAAASDPFAVPPVASGQIDFVFSLQVPKTVYTAT